MTQTSRHRFLQWLQTRSLPYSAEEEADRLFLFVRYLEEAPRAHVRAFVIGQVWRNAGAAWHLRSTLEDEALASRRPLFWSLLQDRAEKAARSLRAMAEHDGLREYATDIERASRVAEQLSGEAREVLRGVDESMLERLRESEESAGTCRHPIPPAHGSSCAYRPPRRGPVRPETWAAHLDKDSERLRRSLATLIGHPLQPTIEAAIVESDALAAMIVKGSQE